LVAVCSRTQERAEAIASKYGARRWYTDYQDLIDDPDIQAVSIVTRESEHFAPTMAAIQAGKHVLLEKPITEDLEEAQQILAASRETGIHVVPGFELRFEIRHALAKERIDSGSLGEIVYVRSRRNTQRRMFERFKRAHPAFVLCSHDVDLLLWYLQDRVVRVRAYERTVNGPHENPNMVMAVLEFERGAVAYLESIWLIPNEAGIRQGCSMEVVGNKGIANINWVDRGINFWEESGYLVPDSSLAYVVNGRMAGAMHDELSYFTDALVQGKAPGVTSLQDAVSGLKICQAIVKSAGTGEEVEI
jgi:predicted dehydrogenase